MATAQTQGTPAKLISATGYRRNVRVFSTPGFVGGSTGLVYFDRFGKRIALYFGASDGAWKDDSGNHFDVEINGAEYTP